MCVSLCCKMDLWWIDQILCKWLKLSYPRNKLKWWSWKKYGNDSRNKCCSKCCKSNHSCPGTQTYKSITKTNERNGKLVYLVTFNFFLRKGKAMLPRIPMTAEIATRPPSTDSRTHCWSAYPYVTESKTWIDFFFPQDLDFGSFQDISTLLPAFKLVLAKNVRISRI